MPKYFGAANSREIRSCDGMVFLTSETYSVSILEIATSGNKYRLKVPPCLKIK